MYTLLFRDGSQFTLRREEVRRLLDMPYTVRWSCERYVIDGNGWSVVCPLGADRPYRPEC